MAQTGRPPRSRERTLEAVIDLYERGETDAADGGVPTRAIADATDQPQTKIRKHVAALEADGLLEQVYGIGPSGPRKSYIPDNGGDA